MTSRPTPRSLLARRFDTDELRGSSGCGCATRSPRTPGHRRAVATLTPRCAYEIVPTGQRWDGHDGARAFYAELFAAFPDNRFALTDIVVGPQGVFEVATLTGTNLGPWAGVPASGCRRPRGAHPVPVGPGHAAFLGERIWFDRGEISSHEAKLKNRALAGVLVCECGK